MAQFSIPNTQAGGAQTINAPSLAAAEQQAQAAGTWNPSAGTFGANSNLGGGGTPTGSSGFSADPSSALSNFFGQTSGFSQQQLAEQKREFDAQLAQTQAQMQQIGIPQIQINQQLAQLQQQQFNSQLQALYGGVGAGPNGTTFGQGTPTEAARQFNVQAQQSQAGLTGNLYGAPTLAEQQLSGVISQPGAGQLGSLSWNDLSNAGSSTMGKAWVDSAAKSMWQQLTGGNASGSAPLGLSVDQVNAILNAGSGGAITHVGQIAGALPQGAYTPGQATQMPTEAASEFSRQLAQQQQQFQGTLGLNYLQAASALQGPQNTFQESNFLRGAQGNPNVPVYLQALQSNAQLPSFTAPGTTAPTPQSAGGLMGQMAGGNATPGFDQNATLQAIQNVYQQGAQKLAPGSLERLSPDELAAFGSGVGAIGGSLPSFLQAYQNSRAQQGAVMGNTTLAG